MPSVSTFKFSVLPPPPISIPKLFSPTNSSVFKKSRQCPSFLYSVCSSRKTIFHSKSSEKEADVEDEWLQKLPDKKKALYSHSLPCVEAWLRSLGFYQSRDDRAVWFVEKPDWHAQLSLDVTDLYIRYCVAEGELVELASAQKSEFGVGSIHRASSRRYLKSGAGSLEKDVERRFSYALSREDIENAILGGP